MMDPIKYVVCLIGIVYFLTYILGRIRYTHNCMHRNRAASPSCILQDGCDHT